MVEINEGILNLLEMVIRCYDCCLSCAAHIVIVEDKDSKKSAIPKDGHELES